MKNFFKLFLVIIISCTFGLQNNVQTRSKVNGTKHVIAIAYNDYKRYCDCTSSKSSCIKYKDKFLDEPSKLVLGSGSVQI